MSLSVRLYGARDPERFFLFSYQFYFKHAERIFLFFGMQYYTPDKMRFLPYLCYFFHLFKLFTYLFQNNTEFLDIIRQKVF